MDTAAPTLNTTPGNNNNCDDDDIIIVIRRKDLPKIEQSKKYPNLYEYLDMLGLDYDYDNIGNNLLVTNKFGKTLTVTKDMFIQLENSTSAIKHNISVTLSVSIAGTKTYALEIFDVFENSRYDMLLQNEIITINNNITFKVFHASVKTEIAPTFDNYNNSDDMCIKSIHVKCGIVIFQKIIIENDDLVNILYKLYPYQDYLKFKICDNGFRLVVTDETIKADPKLTASSCLRQCFNKKYQKALENKMLRNRNI